MFAGIVFAGIVCWETVASAADADQALRRGQRLYKDGYFGQAVAQLEQASRSPDLAPTDKVRALQMLGVSHVALDDVFEAKRAFARILVLDPAYQLPPSVPPKVRKVFKAVRLRMLAVTGVGLRHSPLVVRRGQTAVVQARLVAENPARHHVWWYVRRRGTQAFTRRQLARSTAADFTARVGADVTMSPIGTAFEYYLEATSAADHKDVRGRLGDRRSPLAFQIADPRPRRQDDRPWWKSPWLWVGAATVAAAAVVGGVVAGTAGTAPDPCAGALSCVQAP